MCKTLKKTSLVSFFNALFFKNNLYSLFFLFSSSRPIKNTKNISAFFKYLYEVVTWNKARTLYYLNNWVYTTNHKRIAVNYFWFVILSGIIGMVLATIIRLELAYPGVGIFSGDSLQYLSMVTAHGVIMVFFMIMPLLFGAFGNFLLPTQLGVHDVAFPRLNSAAFWFLPAGLIMLGQLVCIDRRYQRMNCFNIREVQSLLKRKFFTDLINTHDYKSLINKTMIGVKYKATSESFDHSNVYDFFNFGLENSKTPRISPYLWQNDHDNVRMSFFYSLLTEDLNQRPRLQFILKKIFAISHPQNVTRFVSDIEFFRDLTSKLTTLTIEDVYIFCYWVKDILFFILTLPWWLTKKIVTFPYYCYLAVKKPDFSMFTWDDAVKTWYGFLNFCQSLFLRIINLKYSQEFIHIFWICWGKLVNSFFFLKHWITQILTCDDQPYCQDAQPQKNFDSVLDKKDTIVAKKLNPFFYQTNLNSVYAEINTAFLFLEEATRFLIINTKFVGHLKTSILLFNKLENLAVTYLVPSFFDNGWNFWIMLPLNADNVFLITKDRIVEFIEFFAQPIPPFELPFTPGYDYVTLKKKFQKNWFQSGYSYTDYVEDTSAVISAFYNRQLDSFWNILSESLKYENSRFRDLSFYSDFFSNINTDDLNQSSYLEIAAQARNQKFFNPVFKYDYKAGNYFPKLYKETYSYLLSTLSDLTNALRPTVWFHSFVFKNEFLNNFSVFTSVSPLTLKYETYFRPFSWFLNSDAFYNSFFSFDTENLFLNQRWVAINTLNQKFHRMFLTSSMQQRIYSNWRQLKFSREAWRCKLLAARHQKTLYRRYVNEDGVFWSIERNAKDLLPGWAMITPFSSRTRFTAVGKVDIGLMGVFLVLNSSIISGANFLVTYRYLSTLNNRKMRDARAFFAEGVMVASWMMIAANPMLVIGIIMLLSDRHWQTSFFDYSGGGDTILFQHMFWFFGHPEVYVILIPVFGFTNTILSYYLRKRVSARASLLYSMYTIAFLGFFVWGHHMYMVGLAHTTRMLFSTLTVMISVPAATKLMHWCVTLVNSSFTMELPFLFVLTFVFFFVSGGISGMFVAHTGMDILFHDTFYVIGHFHVMLAGGAMFGSFGAFYFYFPAIFGVKYSRIYAYLHYTYYLIGQLMTVIPMFWLGYAGMPRRVLDYPASMGGWHSVISAGHLLSVAGLLAFFIMIFDSLRQSRAVLRNTFGINRYNTRLNFYLYETARLIHIHQKTLHLFKCTQPNSLTLNKLNYVNFEPLESTLLSYSFIFKKI
jgi:heme/copper-type cytochrome/quinol oxidase subunit 1